MQAATVTSSTGTQTGTTATNPAGQLGKEEFLKLLLLQLQHQDPLKPMDDTQFLGQLAQLNTLERLQELDRQMGLLLQVEQLNQAKGLIGKQVEARTAEPGVTAQGTVSSVKMVDGSPVLTIGDVTVKLSDVLSVVEGEEAQLAQASALIGKLVEARTEPSGQTVTGTVDSVKMVDGNATLVIGGRSVRLSDVISVAKGAD